MGKYEQETFYMEACRVWSTRGVIKGHQRPRLGARDGPDLPWKRGGRGAHRGTKEFRFGHFGVLRESKAGES